MSSMALPTGQLPSKDKKEAFVKNMFARIAGQYDKLNDMMTFFLHKVWKQKTIDYCHLENSEAVVLDLCTGTGDMAFMWAKNPNVKKVIAVDSCEEMLEVARVKKKTPKILEKIEFKNADAMNLPYNDNSFDAVTVGFGLRNVTDLKGALQEIKRVLKPGGMIASLDLGHPPAPIINKIYRKIFLQIIPELGEKFAKDKAAYAYLKNSLETWPPQHQLSEIFWKLQYTRSFYKNIFLGSIAIVVAQK